MDTPVILIIDDEYEMRELIAVSLERKLGAQTLLAKNGQLGLEIALEKSPDLIVLDMKMPRMDGWMTARLLRAHPKTAQIPILALTSASEHRDRHRALEAGCDEYMLKPFSPQKLIRTIETILSPDAPVRD